MNFLKFQKHEVVFKKMVFFNFFINLYFDISPHLDISLFELSSFPTGTSFKAILGIELKISSSSFLTEFCCFIYLEICSEIFLDFPL